MSFPKIANHKNPHSDYRRVKQLRQTSSPAEQILWNALRQTAKASGIRFRRQHPIHPYIVDFICLQLKVVAEIDEASHDTRMAYDEKRDTFLRSIGYEVMRFTNQDVILSALKNYR